MNSDLEAFIAKARAKGLADEQIKSMLLANGWHEPEVQPALLGLAVPAPTAVSPTDVQLRAEKEHPRDKHPSISALEAALQHVLLWVFTGTSTIMIGVVAAALFGSSNASSDTLQTYLVVELVTFIPFAALFVHYLRNFRRDTTLKTGRIWSIITIVFHSVGLIGSLITFVLGLVLIDADGTRTATLTGSAAIAIMDGIVVASYVAANFAKNTTAQWRKRLVLAFPVLLFVIIGIFGIYCLLKLGPIRKDDTKRQHLVQTVKDIRDYTKDNNTLPESLAQLPSDSERDGITYTKKSAKRYELCTTFNSGNTSYAYNNNDSEDNYVSDYEFDTTKGGNNCFSFTSSYLIQRSDNPLSGVEQTQIQ